MDKLDQGKQLKLLSTYMKWGIENMEK